MLKCFLLRRCDLSKEAVMYIVNGRIGKSKRYFL